MIFHLDHKLLDGLRLDSCLAMPVAVSSCEVQTRNGESSACFCINTLWNSMVNITASS